MTDVRNHPQTTLPPQDLEAMLDLRRFLDRLDGPAALLGPDGQTVGIPEEAFKVLADVVAAMQLGKAITVAPVDQLLTTQEAADFLGISRPTLVKKLEEGAIDFQKTTGGRHRRVKLVDLIQYRDSQRVQRRTALADLVHEAVTTGAYEKTPEDYTDALKEARAELAAKGQHG